MEDTFSSERQSLSLTSHLPQAKQLFCWKPCTLLLEDSSWYLCSDARWVQRGSKLKVKLEKHTQGRHCVILLTSQCCWQHQDPSPTPSSASSRSRRPLAAQCSTPASQTPGARPRPPRSRARWWRPWRGRGNARTGPRWCWRPPPSECNWASSQSPAAVGWRWNF